jgi:type VI secretion system protein ImpK
MSNDDTFFGSGKGDRTILRPSPGGKRDTSPTPGRPRPQRQSGLVAGQIAGVGASDVNALLSAATPLLTLATELRNTARHPDPDGLFTHVSHEITNFEVVARKGGASPEGVLAGRYILCTFLDEIVLGTPWGNQSTWVNRTLLNAFHNEGWGGEKFYQILDRLLQEPHRNVDLLELQYTCLALGFEGKLRVQDSGRSELERIQTNLYSTIRGLRGEFEIDLSPRWEGVQDKRTPLARYVPLWVVGAVAFGALALLYSGFLISLNAKSDPVAIEIGSLGRNIAPIVDREAYVAEQRVTLRYLLNQEIRDGILAVREEGGASTVVLKGDGLFDSGSDVVRPGQVPVIRAVASALAQIPGQVLITGHTDDRPIRSIRFPSNWHLSKHRADAVRAILAQSVDPTRLLAEPRSSNEPIVSNDTPENRAINRRVEITLFPVPGRQ